MANMREKYESLSVNVLKDLAKAHGLKGISALKKGELVEAMLKEDEKEKTYPVDPPKEVQEDVVRESAAQEDNKALQKQNTVPEN